MAEETKKTETKVTIEETQVGEKIKTKQVEITKFHPLMAHEVGEQPILTEEKALEWIEKGYAKAVK
ncbi:hypothetical protein MUK70_12815 [Dyadobacter chenwenxiniae]|uniref:Uncharacterized protein n=1 Tax=Dyadobacter chenwenxiniae TaxID=2906456 RepID=A0A9X1PH43_9BACT|nr:hypothetical protein [Dyadobacter chenwenxiniae]MCF0060125.1 hypothetical protein [Dyadobacter chenwenxiniae]UON85863.1 hypothetical protein MUK70_12815 [Dyadobacter chenwenxiniae]